MMVVVCVDHPPPATWLVRPGSWHATRPAAVQWNAVAFGSRMMVPSSAGDCQETLRSPVEPLRSAVNRHSNSADQHAERVKKTSE
jgi:hypothetical protein